ncbi:type III secretion system export apparatus subunit SctR (plasmid) [Bradyrhizobium sp. 62B]|uniref:type III secretion system export apparatus subunit SctR n=1 Tax=Bradyrhizobium sp. 62B TaxID=2898442 RepID=UPI0025580A58|nr:type III secretion system export apparatus subunit SctR [Bradyrhizobium sp. 62B]
MSTWPEPTSLIVLMGAVAVIPFLAVGLTSYVKLAVVLGLVRNALGTPNIPPNMALNAIAILLTVYIMQPVALSTYNAMQDKPIAFDTIQTLGETITAAANPVRDFLTKHASQNNRQFFVNMTRELWGTDNSATVTDKDLLILIPAFITSELESAFKIGFLLYLPFIAVDLIVSNILLAMGMAMVSPMPISLPFKLFLFVAVDGWQRLIHGVALSYASSTP